MPLTHGATKCGKDEYRKMSKYVTQDASAAEARRVNSQSRAALGGAPAMVQFHWWDFSVGDFEAAFEALCSFCEPADGSAKTTTPERRPVLLRRLGLTNFGHRRNRASLPLSKRKKNPSSALTHKRLKPCSTLLTGKSSTSTR